MQNFLIIVLNLKYWLSDIYKYEYSIIDGFLDLLYERSMPVEYGAEELNAIDYSKGCYIGQEVVSRVKYQGVIRKKIFKLSFDATNIADLAGEEVLDLRGNKLGVVCSSYKNQAIAILREEKLEEIYLGLEKKNAIIGKYIASIEIAPWRN